ncbi:hypothetical protein BDN71DRAFT_1405413 [Pleurotus eryngii]|uniref:Uncharacterized protein n=1 Tax=Pleurotus eryngii TaxID=5323 RepID=A0A9P5ZEU6_PLEER|nr:hypothetical protein BDN71DRAFT_1405413 [Pleurotus eryngii]
MDNYLAKLYPIPSPHPPSAISPKVYPGFTPASTAALREVLQDNYKKWHVYIDDYGRHNHATHHMLALWSLGADENVIKAAYKSNCSYQKPAFKSPGPIDESNFVEHLGDHAYYNAYMHFFYKVLQDHTVSEVLEKYLFSNEMNFPSQSDGKKNPQMLSRLLDAIVHPLIHIGYGLELNIPGMLVEGLASAAIHQTTSTKVINLDLFNAASQSVVVSTNLMQKLVLEGHPTANAPKENIHALKMMARMLADSRLDGCVVSDPFAIYSKTMEDVGLIIKSYVDEWTLDTADPAMVPKKFEELVWFFMIIYGISTWKGGDILHADFFYMHLITSSLFLPSVLPYLSPRSQVLLLRSYMMVCLTWWVGLGRQRPDIRGFFKADTAYPRPPGPQPAPLVLTFPSPSSPSAITPNPWLPLLQSSIVHVDEHLPKLMRALAHYGTLYGTRGAEDAEFINTGLDGAECLDGTLFIRAAGLTAKWMGRIREGEKPALYKGSPYVVGRYWVFPDSDV